MPFKLIAILYLMVNGYADPTPSHRIPSALVFPSEKECLDFLETPAGNVAKAGLYRLLAADPDTSYKVEFKCRPDAEETL